MKRIVFIFSVLSISLSYAQVVERCATVTPVVDVFDGINLDSINNANRMSNFTYNVKVFVRIIRENNGSNGVRMFEETIANSTTNNYSSGDTIPSVHEELQNLANYYSAFDVCFTLVGFDFIDDSNFASNANWTGTDAQQTTLFNNLIATYPEVSLNVVDIYLLPQDQPYRGRANGIPATALVMTSGRFEWPHMAHEMGHCLALLHTFECYRNNANNCTSWECPDSSNCGNSGDNVCDTPADDPAQLWAPNGCSYSGGNSIFCNGALNPYNPLTNNIMSYANWDCRTSFTAGQKTRIAALLSGFAGIGIVNPGVNDNNLTLSWSTKSSGYTFEAAINSIEAGYWIPSTSFGNYEINGSAMVTFTAGDEIILKPGFIADPGNNGYFNASINQICGN